MTQTILAKVYLWATTEVDASCIGNSTKSDIEELMVDKHGRELETDQIRKVKSNFLVSLIMTSFRFPGTKTP